MSGGEGEAGGPALEDEFGFPVPEDLASLHIAHAERFMSEELERTERWERFVAASDAAKKAAAALAAARGDDNEAPQPSSSLLEAALLERLPKGPIRARRLWCDDDDDGSGAEEEDDRRTAEEEDDEEDDEDDEQQRQQTRLERRRRRRELDRLILGGVPNALRGRVWPLLLRGRERFPEAYYARLLALVAEAEQEQGGGAADAGGSPPPPEEEEASPAQQQRAAWLRVGASVLAQIDKDVPRTFPRQHQHRRKGEEEQEEEEEQQQHREGSSGSGSGAALAPSSHASAPPLCTSRGRAALRRVLAAYAAHRPDHGYAQGMNVWAGGLLLAGVPERGGLAFACLACLAEDVLPGYFCPAMVSPRADQRLLGAALLPERLPHVSSALRALFASARDGDAAASAALPGWLISGFAGALPFSSAARCWDLFFYERTAAASLRVALALLERGGRALEAVAAAGGGSGGGSGGGDTADAAQLLLQLLPASAIDGGALVRAACSGRFCDLTGARVEEMQHAARGRLLGEEKGREAERARRLLGGGAEGGAAAAAAAAAPEAAAPEAGEAGPP